MACPGGSGPAADSRPTGTRKSSAWRSPVKRSPACRNRATPGAPSPARCLHDRLDSILSKYAPTLVIACYGMNDGMMQPFSESGFQAYQQGMERLKKRVEDAGAQFIAITPPPYMADTPEKDAARYNQVLDTYAAWLASRKKDGWKVVDMRPELGRQIREAKKRNPRFIYAGDGVPSRAGGPLHDCQGHLASPRLHPPRARPRPFSGRGRVQESPGAPQPVQAGVADGNGPPPPRHPEGGSDFRSSLHPGGSGRLGMARLPVPSLQGSGQERHPRSPQNPGGKQAVDLAGRNSSGTSRRRT